MQQDKAKYLLSDRWILEPTPHKSTRVEARILASLDNSCDSLFLKWDLQTCCHHPQSVDPDAVLQPWASISSIADGNSRFLGWDALLCPANVLVTLTLWVSVAPAKTLKGCRYC